MVINLKHFLASFILKLEGGILLKAVEQRIKNKLNVVPMEPGCYLMKDRNDQDNMLAKLKS